MTANKRRTIFHIDVNSAFLSWSAIKRLKEDPASVDLRTIASAVGGDVNSRHGVITARSIPAKKYGVVTGEPVVKALAKCPDLKIVEADFTVYKAYSASLMKLLKTYTPVVEQASIDEAYIDITGMEDIFVYEETDDEFPVNVANAIRNEVRSSLGFTVNIGISSNKLLAKMASDFEKPDKVHTLYPEEISSKLWQLPINSLYGCGSSTASRLKSLGIRTIGDAAAMDEAVLKAHLGEKHGSYIYRSANGMNDDEVNPKKEAAKGYSSETTLPHDINSDNYREEAPAVLKYLSENIAGRLKKDDVYAGTISVQVKTDRFIKHSRQMKLSDPVNTAERIYEAASLLLKRLLLGEQGLFSGNISIRLIGISASNLDKGSYRQINMFDLMGIGMVYDEF